MRRAAAVLALLAAAAAAEIIDRVAVSVGDQVITVSAIRRQLRMQAWDQGREVDYSLEARKRAADRLTELALVRRELELSRYVPPPMADVDAQIERSVMPRYKNTEELAASLAKYGFTPDDLREEVLLRLAVARFVEFRFSPGVQVSETEVEDFHKNEYPKLAKARGLEPGSLDDARDAIRRILTMRKTDQALDNWLQQARQQTRVRFFEEAFR